MVLKSRRLIIHGWADTDTFLHPTPLYRPIARTVAPLSLGHLSLAKWCKGMFEKVLKNIHYRPCHTFINHITPVTHPKAF